MNNESQHDVDRLVDVWIRDEKGDVVFFTRLGGQVARAIPFAEGWTLQVATVKE